MKDNTKKFVEYARAYTNEGPTLSQEEARELAKKFRQDWSELCAYFDSFKTEEKK